MSIISIKNKVIMGEYRNKVEKGYFVITYGKKEYKVNYQYNEFMDNLYSNTDYDLDIDWKNCDIPKKLFIRWQDKGILDDLEEQLSDLLKQ